MIGYTTYQMMLGIPGFAPFRRRCEATCIEEAMAIAREWAKEEDCAQDGATICVWRDGLEVQHPSIPNEWVEQEGDFLSQQWREEADHAS